MAGTSPQQLISQAGATRSKYDLAFQVSPIFLVGGIFAEMQGGMMPIIGLYNQLALFNNPTADPNAFFARYLPVPGSTLIANSVGMYPYANLQVAANALIQQPLTLSMLMIAPVNQPGGYLAKLAIFTAVQNALQAHNTAGGTYNIATPAFVYQNLIMTGMSDVTHDESHQQQIQWQLDFIQPLITTDAATISYSNLMARIAAGHQITDPRWSGNSQAQIQQTTTGLVGALAQFGGSFGAAADFNANPDVATGTLQ